jgi:hypothetical protein
MTEPDFWDLAMTALDPWRMKLPRVRLAMYENSIDRTRHDQWDWIERFHRLCQAPGFTPLAAAKIPVPGQPPPPPGTIRLMRPRK